jgi:hypothetical protein
MDEPRLKPGLSDLDLIRRITEGDARALELLFDRYAPLIYRRALQVVHDSSLAQELVSDLFLSTWRTVTRRQAEPEFVFDWLLAMTAFDPEFDLHWEQFPRSKHFWLNSTLLEIRDSIRSSPRGAIRPTDQELEDLQSTKQALIAEIEDFLGRSRSADPYRPYFEEPPRRSVQDITVYLQDILGPRLTALSVGASDAQDVVKWASGETHPDEDVEQKLRHAYSIVRLLRPLESSESIRAWFLGMNPELDDQAPALVLPDDPELVTQAAQNFAATG